eukprot:Skav208220  [mRNA]  locus=scaffold3686:59111:66549:- [translate_table: standard]
MEPWGSNPPPDQVQCLELGICRGLGSMRFHISCLKARALAQHRRTLSDAVMENSPGPADYSTLLPGSPTQKQQKRIRFGKAQRFGRNKDDTPGPCQYSPIDPNVISERRSIGEKTGVTLGLKGDTRKLPGVSDVTPGPGAYNPVKAS